MCSSEEPYQLDITLPIFQQKHPQEVKLQERSYVLSPMHTINVIEAEPPCSGACPQVLNIFNPKCLPIFSRLTSV